MENNDQLINSALAELESCESLELLENARVKYFGKNGEVTNILKNLSKLSEAEKKDMGKRLIYLNKLFSELRKKKECN